MIPEEAEKLMYKGTPYNKLPDKYRKNVDILLYALSYYDVDDADIPPEILEDRESARKLIDFDGNYLRFCNKWQDDEEICLSAIISEPFAAAYVSDRLKDDRDFILKTASADIHSYTNPAWPYKDFDRDLVIELCLMRPSIYKDLSPQQQSDPSILKPLLSYGDFFTYNPIDFIPKKARNLPEIAKLILECDGSLISALDNKYKKDAKYARIAMSSNVEAYRYLSNELQKKDEFIEMAKYEVPLRHFPHKIIEKMTKEDILNFVDRNGLVGCATSVIPCMDDEIMRKGIEAQQMYLLPGYKEREEFMLLALEVYKGDPEYAWGQIAPKFADDEDFAQKAITVSAAYYEFLSPRLQHNEKIMETLVDSWTNDSSGVCIGNLPMEFQYDEKLVKKLLKKAPNQWFYLNKEFKTPENFIIALDHGLESSHMEGGKLLRYPKVMEACRRNAKNFNLGILPPSMCTKELVIDFVSQGADLNLLDDNHPLRHDKDVVLAWLNNPDVCKMEGYFYCDIDVAVAAVKSTYLNINLLAPPFNTLPEVLEAARENYMNQEKGFLDFPPRRIQTKEIVIKCLKEGCMEAEDVGGDFVNDYDVGIAMAKRSKTVRSVGNRLICDRAFLEEVKPFCKDAVRQIERLDYLELLHSSKTPLQKPQEVTL